MAADNAAKPVPKSTTVTGSGIPTGREGDGGTGVLVGAADVGGITVDVPGTVVDVGGTEVAVGGTGVTVGVDG